MNAGFAIQGWDSVPSLRNCETQIADIKKRYHDSVSWGRNAGGPTPAFLPQEVKLPRATPPTHQQHSTYHLNLQLDPFTNGLRYEVLLIFLWLQVRISQSPVFRSDRSSRFAQFILAKLLLYASLRSLCSLCRPSSLCSSCGNTEDRSCPVRPVWSGLRTNCIKPLKPSGPISLRSSFHFIVYVRLCVCVCVVYVCLCVCTCVFVCATYQWPSIPSQSRRGVAAFGVVSSIIRRELRNGALPPCHMTALQPY